MGITSSGAVSGLDVPGLVSKIMASENQILTPLTTLAASYNAQLSAYGNVKSALSTFESALSALNVASFSAQKPTIINSGTGSNLSTNAFTATVNPTDTTTAQAQKLQSAGIDPTTTTYNSGDTLAIKVGSNTSVFITLSANTTITGLADQINAAKANVVASVTTDAQGSHLVLQSNIAGTANTIRVTGNGSLSPFAYDPASGTPTTMTQIQAPQDPIAATSGSYNIAVTALAQNEVVKSAAFSSTQTFNNGVLALKVGSNPTVLITPTSNTLGGIRDAINNGNLGVNATIVTSGTTSNLVLTAANSGAANTITVSGTGDFGPLSTGTWNNDTVSPAVQTATTMVVTQAAQDAAITVDGVTITNSSNQFINPIPGVTINASTVSTSTDKYNLSVSNDASGVQTAANRFVSAYNAVAQSLSGMTAYNASTKAAGPLQGDSAVTGIQNQLRNALIQAVGTAGSLKTLNDVGISLQKDGTLALDTKKLASATTNSFNDIQKLFTSTDGVVTRLNTIVTGMLSDTGVVSMRTSGLQTSLKMNSDRLAQMQLTLDATQARYTAQFNALDVTLTNLQGTQSALTSQLASLSK
jgi:flagellar hook-associated protein 2